MWYMLCTNWVVFENNKCIISIGTQSWIGSLWVSFKKWQKLKSLWSLLELGLIKSRPKWTNSSGIMNLKLVWTTFNKTLEKLIHLSIYL